MDRIDLALLLAPRATAIEATSARPDAPLVPLVVRRRRASRPRRWWLRRG